MIENKRFVQNTNLVMQNNEVYVVCGDEHSADVVTTALNELINENEQLKEENEYLKELLDKYEIETNDFDKFMNNREHIRLSINVETNELQRHIYGTGNWFGDFDRVLVKKWLDESTYQEFINRIIEVYNTEFKKR